MLNHPWRKSNAFARPSLKPYITVVLTFLCTLVKHARILGLLERAVPWDDLARFFNTMPRGIVNAELELVAKGLTAPIPITDTLTAVHRSLPARPSPEHASFACDVLFLVDCTVTQQSQPREGAVSLPDPHLRRLAEDAIATLLTLLAATPKAAPPLTAHLAKAFYLRGTLYASGGFPEHVPHNPRDAFKDFESGARGGFQKAWFTLGREYEDVGDVARACTASSAVCVMSRAVSTSVVSPLVPVVVIH